MIKQWRVLLSLFCATVSGQEQTPVRPLETGAVRLKGWLGEKIDLCVQNGISSRSVENLLAPFRTRTETSCWQSEFWGKWMLSAVDGYRQTSSPLLKAKMDSAVTGLLATQSADGYIGN